MKFFDKSIFDLPTSAESRDDRDGTGQWEWKIRNKNAAISRLETGTTSPQGTTSTQPYGFVAKASRFQPSGGTPKNVKNWTTFVPLGVPSLSSLVWNPIQHAGIFIGFSMPTRFANESKRKM